MYILLDSLGYYYLCIYIIKNGVKLGYYKWVYCYKDNK
jgi:hypothetical protein